MDFGRAPWQVVKADVEITLNNSRLKQATVLDMNGNARAEVRLERSGAGVRLRFPEDAMYVVLE